MKLYHVYCRLFQNVIRAGAYFLGWYRPELLKGKNSLMGLHRIITERKIHRVMIVTDQGISSLGLMEEMLKSFERAGIEYFIYDKTVPNPTIENIEEVRKEYLEHQCEAIIGFGGGSSIDCAKGLGARIARPNKQIRQMKGLFKIRRKLPPLIAVPTTSGTGSEATVAAVITDSRTHEKYPLEDIVLIPHFAVLDPVLTTGLPPHITSTTGMDALTHAVEAYIGRSNTRETIRLSRVAVRLIFDNIYEAYANGKNLAARENMQMASYYAGIAFTRAYVGNIHAVAHTLGGLYSIPHGLANAVILPYVLEYYGAPVYKKLAELAEAAGIADDYATTEQKAKQFIQAVKDMNRRMNIPEKLEGIKEKDIPVLVGRAYAEANPLYPVPVIFSKEDFKRIYDAIRE